MAASNTETPKITLYTNHRCPWAHRAHIVIKELGLPYEEVIIDLDTPREPWYLEVNPRGLVPSIKFSSGPLSNEIITESAIVAQFLADAYPSHLVPVSGDVKGALTRARINFFVDTWFSKVSPSHKILLAEEEDKAKLIDELIASVAKEIEPLLKDSNPFFGGSEKFTLAEALTAPFILRLYALSKAEVLPGSLHARLDELPNFSKWAARVIQQESVTYIWDEQKNIEGTIRKVAQLKSQKK